MHALPVPAIDGCAADIDPSGPFAALNAFYRAFNQRDLASMVGNWNSGPEVSMSNPLGGIARGWPAIHAVYERIFNGAALVQVAFHDYSIHASGDFFYAVGRERGHLSSGTAQLELAIRTSRLYRRIDGVWRQVHHHGSFEDPEQLAAYREAVR